MRPRANDIRDNTVLQSAGVYIAIMIIYALPPWLTVRRSAPGG